MSTVQTARGKGGKAQGGRVDEKDQGKAARQEIASEETGGPQIRRQKIDPTPLRDIRYPGWMRRVRRREGVAPGSRTEVTCIPGSARITLSLGFQREICQLILRASLLITESLTCPITPGMPGPPPRTMMTISPILPEVKDRCLRRRLPDPAWGTPFSNRAWWPDALPFSSRFSWWAGFSF